MRRDARTLRVALLRKSSQIAQGLSDKILIFLERNMRRDARTLRVALVRKLS
ncbi:MAG: hypothetical protein AAGJ08_18020 [Cyanobacteria bacterium P01_H01_bin.35]